MQIDGKIVEAKSKVSGGEHIDLDLPRPADTNPAAEDIALDIVYEDDSLMVIDKPAGLVVHPGNGNVGGTVMNALLHHAAQLAALPRAGIVHRLDKDTSGLMVIAKTEQCYTALVRQLQARTVTREYLAIVHGVAPLQGKVDAPIGRHPTQRVKMAISHRGKPATTHFQRLKHGEKWSLLRCTLETGRTHQIRVHLAERGFPIVGDPTYGPRTFDTRLPLDARGFARQALHATRLVLVHPLTGESAAWQCAAPTDFSELLNALEKHDPAK